MELVEIVRGLATREATIARALDVREGPRQDADRRARHARASRRAASASSSAPRRCACSRRASRAPQDIDRGMELGYRHPMGPLKLTDLVGLDVRLAILEHLQREIGEQFRPPAILRTMVRAGKLGKKTGEGFYRWVDGQPVAK